MTICHGLTWDTPCNSNSPLLACDKWKISISFPLTKLLLGVGEDAGRIYKYFIPGQRLWNGGMLRWWLLKKLKSRKMEEMEKD